MKAIRNITCATLLAVALAGCGSGGGGSNQLQLGFQHISVLDGTSIAVHARSGPDAIVSAAGTLSIDGKDVQTTPAQQDLLKRYFASVAALRADAIATGMAGVATAGTAIRSVVSGLANGTPDQIGPAVEARAATVEAQAAKVCNDLADVRSTQEAVAAQLAAFRPYALIDAQQVNDCGRSRVVHRP